MTATFQRMARWDSAQVESQDDKIFSGSWPDKTVRSWKAKMTATFQQMARWDSKQAEIQDDSYFLADDQMRQ